MFQFPFGSFLVKEVEDQRASSLIKRFGVLARRFFRGGCVSLAGAEAGAGVPAPWGAGRGELCPSPPRCKPPTEAARPQSPRAFAAGLGDVGCPEKPGEDPACRDTSAPAAAPLEDACLGGVLLLNPLIRKLKTGAMRKQISARCLCPS